MGGPGTHVWPPGPHVYMVYNGRNESGFVLLTGAEGKEALRMLDLTI